EAGQHPGRARAHQVQGRGVGGAAPHDHRDVQLVDESLEVQGSRSEETCSAETVVPRMKNRSTPASTTVFQWSWVRCGARAPAAVTPASRSWLMRSRISSGLTGSE